MFKKHSNVNKYIPNQEIDIDMPKLIKSKVGLSGFEVSNYGVAEINLSSPFFYREMFRKVEQIASPVIYIDVDCKFHKQTRRRRIETCYTFYFIGYDNKLYRLKITTFISCMFINKTYDSDMIELTGAICDCILRNNTNGLHKLTSMDLSVPDYSKIRILSGTDYVGYSLTGTALDEKDGIILNPDTSGKKIITSEPTVISKIMLKEGVTLPENGELKVSNISSIVYDTGAFYPIIIEDKDMEENDEIPTENFIKMEDINSRLLTIGDVMKMMEQKGIK